MLKKSRGFHSGHAPRLGASTHHTKARGCRRSFSQAEGLPAIALCSEQFEAQARYQAELLRASHVPQAFVKHPISDQTASQMREKASDVPVNMPACLCGRARVCVGGMAGRRLRGGVCARPCIRRSSPGSPRHTAAREICDARPTNHWFCSQADAVFDAVVAALTLPWAPTSPPDGSNESSEGGEGRASADQSCST